MQKDVKETRGGVEETRREVGELSENIATVSLLSATSGSLLIIDAQSHQNNGKILVSLY